MRHLALCFNPRASCEERRAHVAKKWGHGEWTGGMIRHILTNETYIGVWHFGKTKMVKAPTSSRKPDKSNQKRGLGKQVARPREEWIAVNAPAFINRNVFDAAQKRLARNKEQSQRNAKREYLMGRRLRCLKCGYTYVGRTRREKHQYYSGTRQ